MENVNKITKGFPTKTFKAIAMMALVMTFAACGNKGGDSAAGTNVNGMYVDGCTNCGAITNPVIVNTVTSYSVYGNVAMNLQVYADQSQYQYYGSLNSYHGPIALQGTMVVTSDWYEVGSFNGYGYGSGYINGIVGGGCRIAPGTYQIRTVTAAQGINGNGVISNMEVVTTTGNIRMSITGAMIVGNTLLAVDGPGVVGGIHPSIVNGVTCAPNFGAAFGYQSY